MMIMVHLKCVVYCLSALFIKHCISIQVNNEQLEDKQIVSVPENEISLANKLYGSSKESERAGLIGEEQDDTMANADYGLPIFARNTRDVKGRFREKYGGEYPFIKYSPLKRKLKAGEIVKLLERIAERRGIQISNKALRYGISRRSVE